MVPNAVYAQDPDAPGSGQAAPQAAQEEILLKRWHQAPRGLVSTPGTEAFEGPFDLAANVSLSYESFNNLQRPSGRSKHASRWIYEAEGEASLVVNQEGVKTGGNTYRIGLYAIYQKATGRYASGVDLLNFDRMGGGVSASVRSSEALNGPLSYYARIVAGAVYKEHGDISNVQGHLALDAEIGYRLAPTWGLVAGFNGDMDIGDRGSYWLDGELSAGVRVVTENVTLDFRGILVAYDRDSNTLTGNFLKVEHERLHPGVRASVLLWGAVSAFVEYTWGRDRIEIDQPNGDFSDDSYGQTFRGGLGVVF